MFVGFQFVAFQSVWGGTAPQVGGGGKPKEKYIAQSYELGKHAYEMQQLEAKRKEAETALRANEYRIRDLEERRLRALANKAMQAELVALILEAQKLEAEKERLEALILFYMREEDDILAILYSMPFAV